jgi:hypothetical protein
MSSNNHRTLAGWAREVFCSPQDATYWFGYYYQSSLSADGRCLLAHRTEFDGREIQPADQAEVGYFDLRDASWHGLGLTRAFNWQQGAMLQWLGPDFQSRLIYNDQEGRRFVARIVDLSSSTTHTVPWAVYAVHPSGRTALGVRFERHYFTRAYHYEGIRDEQWNVPVHPEDGILSIDLETGKSGLILRTAEIAALDPGPDTAGAPHWLEHLLWNPSGTRFGFLHRYGSNTEFQTRVFTADATGGSRFCLPGHNCYRYTHMGWRDDRTFVVFAERTKRLGQAYAAMAESENPGSQLMVWLYREIKRILPRGFTMRRHTESGYALVHDGECVQRLLSTGPLWGDGHPNWTRNGRFMLTDTYADDQGFRHLLLYDAQCDRVQTVGRFFSPINGGSFRCDLHPRFSRDEKYVSIDTAHSGRRQTMAIQLDWDRIVR